MGTSAIASSESVRLPLSNGDFLTVKKELNTGESLDLGDDPGNRTLATVLAYLVGWSLVGSDGAPLPYSPMQSLDERRDMLRALKTSVFEEMTDALLPHIKAARRVLEEKKTTPPVEVGSV